MKNKIIAVGSVDGVLTAAALIRWLGDAEIIFTQAFKVQETLVSIQSGDRVWLVDLAVNNRNPKYTSDFVKGVNERGAKIVAIADEHGADAWYGIAGIDWDEVQVHPLDRSEKYPSSGAVLRAHMESSPRWDDYCTKLTQYADLADKGQFIGLGELVNKAVKADIKDQNRRAYLANHFATTSEPDEQILEWLDDYKVLEANTKTVVESSYQDGELYFFDSREFKVDRTSMVVELDTLYPSAKVAVCRGLAYDRDRSGMFPCYTFMLRNNFAGVNLREILPNGWGMEAVMNVEDEDYPQALALVKASL